MLFSAAMRLQRDDRCPNNVFRPHSMLKMSSFFRLKIRPKEESMMKIERMKIMVGIFIFKRKIVRITRHEEIVMRIKAIIM